MKKVILVIVVLALVAAGFYFGANYGSKKAETSTEKPVDLTSGISANEAAELENKAPETSAKQSETSFYEKAAEFVKNEKSKDEDHINTKPEYHKFVLYDGFGVMTEDDGATYAYMWIVDMSYYKEDGKVEQGSGSSTAYKVKFVDGEVVSYENPTDGAGNIESTKKLFPEDVANKIIAYNFDFTRLDKEVEEYYK